MRSWTAAGPRAQWSVEECAEFAARRQFKFVSMLSRADESVVVMALRMQGVLIVDDNVSDVGVQHGASAAHCRDLREVGHGRADVVTGKRDLPEDALRLRRALRVVDLAWVAHATSETRDGVAGEHIGF